MCLTFKIDVKMDPLFEEIKRLSDKSERFADDVGRLIAEDNLIHVQIGGAIIDDSEVNKLSTVIHLTDAALELLYREGAR